ncbi:FAD-binding oxidoreductase [Candidatus Poribacteria bacterium]|nr:FAD-binding oxidoreductase [Candidatus Poribacteria bacterium]
MESSTELVNKLRHLVEESCILQGDQVSAYTYDSIVPEVVVLPASVQEMQNVLQFASAHDYTVMPAGAGTKLGVGNLPPKTDIVLATTHLNSVVEYEPADLTVTVEAGIRLADLQTDLAKHRQFFPLNPPYGNRCTIGGIVATNASGPLRLQYGTARNLVLGMHVVHANGTVVKSGGKVVKNVAGYDLNKLYIGAFGTLGIITEVTLKLAPLPARQAIVAAQFQNVQDAVNTGLCIVSSQTLPTFVNLCTNLCIDQFSDRKPTLIVGFGGDSDTVTWQLNSAQSLVEQNGALGVQIIEGESQESISHFIQEFSTVDKATDTATVKVNLKRTDIAEFAEIALEVTDKMMALLGNGVLYLKITSDSDTDLQELANTLTELRQNAVDAGGNLIIEAAPPELKRQIDVWGSIGSTLNLMKQVKAKFDGGSVLNPGRFVSGI